MNALKSQNQTPYPLESSILPFPGLKPEWTYDGTAFTSILLIGMSLAIIPGSFAIEVVALRQVRLTIGLGLEVYQSTSIYLTRAQYLKI